MKRRTPALSFLAVLAFTRFVRGQTAPVLTLPPDSPRWELEGDAKPAEHQGRACLRLGGGGASVKDLDFHDGVIDVDVSSSGKRAFFGIQFRIASDGSDGEWVYLRPHKSGLPDALQYTPVLHTGLNWQIYSGPGFTAAAEIPRDVWLHLRLEVTGAQARLFVGDMEKPALVMPDLKSGIRNGGIALAALTGETYFANFEVRPMPPAAWERRLPPMPPRTLTGWELSPSYDALARDLERPPTAAEVAATPWQKVEAEPPGFVVINRYRDSPHPRVTFQSDFSTRLEPQPGTRVVYGKTTIVSDRDETRRLDVGYSDEVRVYLNGRILWRGRSAQSFRDPGFLGLMSADDDAVYLPLKKGANELILAVSELGGGWGFVCRLEDVGN